MSDSTATLLHSLPAAKKNRRELIAWALAGAGILGLLVVLGLSFRRQEVNVKPMRFVIAMPDKVSGMHFPIISLDGNTIAFLGTCLKAEECSLLEGLTRWMPRSSRALRMLRFHFGHRMVDSWLSLVKVSLRKIDVNGGPPQVLCDAPNAGGGTWNRDGLILFGGDAKPIQQSFSQPQVVKQTCDAA